MSHIVDLIDMLMSTFEAIPSTMMIGESVVNYDRVITKQRRGMFVRVGVLVVYLN
jgi:hypothetical protein